MRKLNHKNLELTIADTGRVKKKNRKLDQFMKASLEVFFDFLKSRELLIGNKQAVELGLTFCGTQKIKKLNCDYRSKEKATDVLSFPLYDSLRKGAKGPFFTPSMHLGDIFICKEVAKKQAREFDLPYEAEIAHLLVHGFLHLLGFDHEVSMEEEKIMNRHESRLVKKIYEKVGI